MGKSWRNEMKEDGHILNNSETRRYLSGVWNERRRCHGMRVWHATVTHFTCLQIGDLPRVSLCPYPADLLGRTEWQCLVPFLNIFRTLMGLHSMEQPRSRCYRWIR